MLNCCGYDTDAELNAVDYQRVDIAKFINENDR